MNVDLCYYRKFTHENLVKLYGVCSQQGPIFIVTELMKNGKHCLVYTLYVIMLSPHKVHYYSI